MEPSLSTHTMVKKIGAASRPEGSGTTSSPRAVTCITHCGVLALSVIVVLEMKTSRLDACLCSDGDQQVVVAI
jgi:hypothetical protein